MIIILFVICNTTDVAGGAGTDDPSGTHGFIYGFWCLCWSNFRFLCSVLSVIVYHFVAFHLEIVSILLRFTTSGYPFDIFNVFLTVESHCVNDVFDANLLNVFVRTTKKNKNKRII